MKQFYVVSLKHTHKGILCFWGPNDAGYTENLFHAGIYTEDQIKASESYYNNEDNFPVEVEKVRLLFSSFLHVEFSKAGVEIARQYFDNKK